MIVGALCFVIAALLVERAVSAVHVSRERTRLVILATQGTTPAEKATQLRSVEPVAKQLDKPARPHPIGA
jgi:hypothetical protein